MQTIQCMDKTTDKKETTKLANQTCQEKRFQEKLYYSIFQNRLWNNRNIQINDKYINSVADFE